MFELRVSTEHKVPVIHVAGEITMDCEEELRAAFRGLPANTRQVILEFGATRYANSAGLSVLLALITQATEDGQRIDLCGLTSHFKKVMDIVGVEAFAAIYPDLEAALQALPD